MEATLAKPASSTFFRPVLRQRRPVHAEYARAVRDEERMIFWLARVAKEARLEADRKQVHIGAAADVDQSVIARFERGRTWPRELDAIIRGYEDELGLDPLSIWSRALDLRGQWEIAEAVEGVEGLAQGDEGTGEAGFRESA